MPKRIVPTISDALKEEVVSIGTQLEANMNYYFDAIGSIVKILREHGRKQSDAVTIKSFDEAYARCRDQAKQSFILDYTSFTKHGPSLPSIPALLLLERPLRDLIAWKDVKGAGITDQDKTRKEMLPEIFQKLEDFIRDHNTHFLAKEIETMARNMTSMREAFNNNLELGNKARKIATELGIDTTIQQPFL